VHEVCLERRTRSKNGISFLLHPLIALKLGSREALIQPITVRPNQNGFEIVAGARRFRASQLAEVFSLPARIVELDDAQAMEWQLVENSQRVDVHPYEEAQGFQRLLDLPGYDVTTLVEKSGKSASHIYARLSLLQLIPAIAQAFTEERITASHANLLARLPQEHQASAFEQCWRKDWSDKEPHLLPAKHLTAWIQANLYLSLAEAPFDREDTTLNPTAGACVTCPRRSGFNTSLFHDVQGDQCLDAPCYQTKVTAHIDRELAAQPQLVQLETAWRNPKEQRPGALQKHQYRELDTPNNPDAEPPCPATTNAIIVFGRNAGKTIAVCTDTDCPVHNPHIAKQRAADPPPTMAPAALTETEEEAEQRKAEYQERQREYEAEQQRKEEERKQQFEQQQKEFEAEQTRKDKLRKTRDATFERIVANAPATFTAPQLRVLLRAIVNLDPYTFADDLADDIAGENENEQRTAEEVLLTSIDGLRDDKLTGFTVRLALAGHRGIPAESEFDFLAEAENVFAPPPPEQEVKPKKAKKPAPIKSTSKPVQKAQVKRPKALKKNIAA
jgi:ParB family chromosome partitioning protein